MAVEDGSDRWPTFALSPTEYERAVAGLVRAAGYDVVDWQVRHLSRSRECMARTSST